MSRRSSMKIRSAGNGLINRLAIEYTFVMPAKAGIQELFKLVPGFRREDN